MKLGVGAFFYVFAGGARTKKTFGVVGCFFFFSCRFAFLALLLYVHVFVTAIIRQAKSNCRLVVRAFVSCF